MRILLVAATLPELAPLFSAFSPSEIEQNLFRVNTQNHEIDILLAGTGSVPFLYTLGKYRASCSAPDLAILAGIAGSFNPNFPVGTLVEITSEILADTGAEDRDGGWLSMFDLGLWQPGKYPFREGKLMNLHPVCSDLPQAKSITVNTVSGTTERISKLQNLYFPEIENMEGAAFFFWALCENIPFSQIRSISNKVEPRDRNAWNLGLAVTNLNNYLIDLLTKLI